MLSLLNSFKSGLCLMVSDIILRLSDIVSNLVYYMMRSFCTLYFMYAWWLLIVFRYWCLFNIFRYWWLFNIFRYWWWLIRWFIITCFLMDTYPILACVWCACFLLYGVSNMVKEGSHSHLLVGIYTMHHFLPLPV